MGDGDECVDCIGDECRDEDEEEMRELDGEEGWGGWRMREWEAGEEREGEWEWQMHMYGAGDQSPVGVR